jgi:uncharacterized protein (UPF0218 family)
VPADGEGTDEPHDTGGEDGDDRDEPSPEANTVLMLPDELRAALEDPMGPVYTDSDRLRGELGSPVVAVGDVVTRHLTDAGARPDLAVVDWVTEREPLPAAERPEIEGYDTRIDVTNPAAALTGDLLAALREGVERSESTVIVVDGEEDLAAVPALVVAPAGASVVYGQPGEGMVHVQVDDAVDERARGLLARMDGSHDQAWSALSVGPRD